MPWEPPPPRSAVEAIRWPSLPDAAAAALLSTLYQVELSQWWPTERILARQLEQLGAVVEHARATVPYYRERLAHAGVRSGPWSLDALRELPLLTRQDIQRAGAALHSARVPKTHGKVGEIQTSGSTGRPVRVLSTDVTRFFWRVLTLRDHAWHQRDLSGTLAAIRKPHRPADYPDGLATSNWGAATRHAFATGPSVVLDIHTDPAAQAEWLQRMDPTYLLTFPSNAKALARRCQEAGYRFPSLRQVRTISEVLTPDVERACRDAFGVPVVDLYSTQEVGYVALQCASSSEGARRYHVQSETVLCEVLDEAGAPCPPGQVGRVVVTALHNFASPLVRYELGDHAALGPPCLCGRGLPVLEQIRGRVRNMVTTPDGRQQWPLLGDGMYATIGPVRQYQFVQRELDTIDCYFVVDRPLRPAEIEPLRALILSKLPYPFTLRFHYPEAIARSETGSYEDFRSEL